MLSKYFIRLLTIVFSFFSIVGEVYAESRDRIDRDLKEETFRGLERRSIGPAFMSGRGSDIEIDRTDRSVWYVAAGSGGVWKTGNRGTSWTPRRGVPQEQ